jgi:hypothetical protein
LTSTPGVLGAIGGALSVLAIPTTDDWGSMSALRFSSRLLSSQVGFHCNLILRAMAK